MLISKIVRAALVLTALTTIGCAGEGDNPTEPTGTGGATMTPDASPAAPDADPTPVTCSPAAGTSIELTVAQVKTLDAVGAPTPTVSVSATEPNPTSAACSGARAAV